MRHTANVVTAARDAALAVKKAREQEHTQREQVRWLTTKRLGLDTAIEVFERVLGIDLDSAPTKRQQNQLDVLVQLYRRSTGIEGRTAWDAFNTVSSLLSRLVPRVQVVRIPVPPTVDSLVIGLHRTLTALEDAANAHASAAEKHRVLARESEQAAIIADGAASRASRIANKIAAIVACP